MNTAKVELHLHLDGSLNLKWAYEKALLRNVIDKDMTFEEYYQIMFSHSVNTAAGFKKFDILCDVLQLREDLFEATYNLVKRLDELGLIYAEIRFASQQHCKEGLSQYDALKAVVDGANKAMAECGIKVNIINCLMHKGESAQFNYEQNLETIYATKKLLGKGACALDLAGYENNCDFNDYAPLFEIARNEGIPYTIHAGEMGIGEHVLDAINMGASRIGHGIDCVQDEKYLKAVVDSQIPLEVCVSSNIRPGGDYSKHPIRTLIENGVNVTINTDNMIFSKSDLINEHNQLWMIGVSEEQLRQCTINAINAAFVDDETKKELLSKV